MSSAKSQLRIAGTNQRKGAGGAKLQPKAHAANMRVGGGLVWQRATDEGPALPVCFFLVLLRYVMLDMFV